MQNTTPSINHPTKKANKSNPSILKVKTTKSISQPPGVCTPNPFQPLSDHQDEVILTKDPAVKPIKIPPITIFNCDKNEIHHLCQTNNITNYRFKLLRIGVHLYCPDETTFNQIVEVLKSMNKEFYTHDLPNQRHFRVVLKGLHKMDSDSLINELKTVNLTPIDVKPLTPKNQNNYDYCFYIVSFMKNQTNLKFLRQIKVLFHTIIRWEPYKILRSGPVQCSKCQRPGHGARHCNMMFRCLYCGESHNSLTCEKQNEILKKLEEAQSNPNVTIPSKCCNCGNIGHLANDVNCPRKIQYAESRRKLSNMNRTSKQQFIKVTDDNYPFLPNTDRVKLDQTFNRSRNIQPLNQPSSFINFNSIHNSSNRINSPFSTDEILTLTSDILNHLQNFNSISREQVILSVMQISLKYLFNNGC